MGDKFFNCSYRDRAADELGHRDVTSGYPGKFKRLLSGILFLMLLTKKIGIKIMKKLREFVYQCILCLKFAMFTRKQHFHFHKRSISRDRLLQTAHLQSRNLYSLGFSISIRSGAFSKINKDDQ